MNGLRPNSRQPRRGGRMILAFGVLCAVIGLLVALARTAEPPGADEAIALRSPPDALSDDLPDAPSDLRERDVAVGKRAADGSIELVIDVKPDEVGFLLHASATDPAAPMAFIRIVSPSGEVLHRESGPIDEPLVDSRIANTSWSGEGELALFLPNASALGPVTGTWRMKVALPDGDALRRAQVIAVRSTAGPIRKRLHLSLLDATRDGLFSGTHPHGGGVDVMRGAMDAVLDTHGLGIGRIERLGRAHRSTRGSLNIADGSERDLCRQAARLTDSWALPVVLVDGFDSGDGEQGEGPVEHDEAEDLIGWAPVPGTLRAPDSAGSCVFIGPHTEFDDETVRHEAIAMTLLHEAGHFMGLEHVSESDGLAFDRLDDTAQCRVELVDGQDDETFGVPGELDGIVDDFECGRAGGADNLMFWSGVVEFSPFVLSAGQAEVIARHPLFRPVAARRSASHTTGRVSQ